MLVVVKILVDFPFQVETLVLFKSEAKSRQNNQSEKEKKVRGEQVVRCIGFKRDPLQREHRMRFVSEKTKIFGTVVEM